MYVLIVMTFVSGGWNVSMQEFQSIDTCKEAGRSIERVVKTERLELYCQRK